MQRAARLAPDWLVAAAWPPLKLSAVTADVRLLRHPRSTRRRIDVGLRAADWALFVAFPRLVGSTPRATTVSALTAGQLLATAAVIIRTRADQPSVARRLAPQAVWLAYATVVPLVAVARA